MGFKAQAASDMEARERMSMQQNDELKRITAQLRKSKASLPLSLQWTHYPKFKRIRREIFIVSGSSARD